MIDIKYESMSTYESQEIGDLLQEKGKSLSSMSLRDLQEMLDDVWNRYECDNNQLNWDKINLFYDHPVWLLNGLFAEQDKLSMQNRSAIADWIALNKNSINSVLDYGGGFGTIARLIQEKHPDSIVDIYEPHPSLLARKKAEIYPNIHFIDSFHRQYDCLISTDVLEHVPDPLMSLSEMVDIVKIEGYLAIANCFYPSIKCHLPKNFHFRFSFDVFAKMMGLEVLGLCDGGHATLYKKVADKQNEWKSIRRLEKVSRALFPILEMARRFKCFLQGIKA